jgi:hypothetical protein
MRQIISTVCVVLWIAIWICVMGIVIADWDGDGLKMLIAGGLVAAITTVALAQELGEWRRHTEASPLKRLSLPPVS